MEKVRKKKQNGDGKSEKKRRGSKVELAMRIQRVRKESITLYIVMTICSDKKRLEHSKTIRIRGYPWLAFISPAVNVAALGELKKREEKNIGNVEVPC